MAVVTGRDALLDGLRNLPPAGAEGFEGLVRVLLEAWTGRLFRLARGGAQFGHDAMTDPGPSAPTILVECKRYDENNKPSSRELMAEVGQALSRYPNLDLWVLVATTEIPSTGLDEVSRLVSMHGVELLVIDTRPDGGLLELLCAGYPDITTTFLAAKVGADEGAIRVFLDGLRGAVDFASREKGFRDWVSGLQLGFADARAMMAEHLRRQVAERNSARAEFGQDLALRGVGVSLIPRLAIFAAMDAWWQGGALKPFSLVGEEGAGKSWAAVAWLLRLLDQPDYPLVIPLMSRNAHEWARRSPTKVISMVLMACNTTTTSQSSELWERRVRRWLTHVETAGRPLVIFLLDGLNESPDAPWRQFISELRTPDHARRLGALITCRKPYWDERLAVGSDLDPPLLTEGYDEAELKQAVAELRKAVNDEIDLSKVPPSLRQLMRRPRYCDLVVKHFAAMLASGDFTIARLMFVDRLDRYGRKQNHPLTPDEFDDVLRGLVVAHRDEWKRDRAGAALGKREIRNLLPEDNSRALQEVIDCGVLERSEGRYRVEPMRLVYGLGMLLASDLRQEVGNFADVIQEWFEPQRDMDIKTEILGAAIFFSLPTQFPGYPSLQRQALLHAWLSSRNMPPEQVAAISAYLPDCAEDILIVTEALFEAGASARDEPMVRLGRAISARKEDARVHPHFLTAVEKWAGYVPESADGPRFVPVATSLGPFVEIAPIDQRGQFWVFISAILQSGPRLPYARVYARLWMAMGYSQGYTEDDFLRWSARLTDDCLDEAILSILPDVKAAGGAGHALLRAALGTRSFRQSSDFQEATQRAGLHGAAMWERSPWELALNPVSDGAAEFEASIRRKLAALSLDDYIPSRHRTQTTHDFELLEPIVARLAPDALAGFLRSLLRSLPGRQAENLSCISLYLPGMMMVAGGEERDAVAVVRRRMEALFSSDGQSLAGRANLAWVMGGMTPQQVDAFIDRPNDCSDLLKLCGWFQPQSDAVSAHVHARLLTERDPKRLHRCLFVAGCSPRPLSQAQREIIARCLDHADGGVRYSAALYALRSKDEALFAAAATSSRPLMGEDGKLGDRLLAKVLIRHGALMPYEEVARRLPLPDLSAAVAARGMVADEVAALGKSLDDALAILRSSPLSAIDSPKGRAIAETCELGGVSVYLFDEPESKPARTRVDSPEAVEQLRRALGGNDDWDGQAEAEARRNRLRAFIGAGRPLNQGEFSLQALRGTYSSHPRMVANWVEPALGEGAEAKGLRHDASAFFQSLAAALVHEAPPLGFRLWKTLYGEGVSLTFNLTHAGTGWMTCLPFQAPNSPEAEAARKEMLDQALGDIEFLELANAATASGRLDWLRKVIGDHVTLKPLWRRGKGLTLAALCDFEGAEFDALVAEADVDGTWVGDALPVMRGFHDRNRWAKHWYRQFLTAPHRDAGYAGFVLFLKCADRRCRLWMETLEREAAAGPDFDEWRLRYRRTVDDTIANAITENERGLAATLFGLPFRRDEIIPYGLRLAPDIHIPPPTPD